MTDPRSVFPDNVYLTLESTNQYSQAAGLNFASNGSSNVIPNPSMYYLFITKFVLPNRAFPIFVFDNTKEDYYVIVNGVKHLLTMQAGDFRGNPYGLNESSSYGGIYFIRQFLNILNRDLGASQMILLDDGRFELTAGPASIVFSKRIYDLFPTMDATYTGVDYQMVVDNIQESKAQYAWYDIKSIILLSNDLPILHQGYVTSQDSRKKLKILNEFPVIYDQSNSIDKTDWVFESNQYRPIDLISQEGFQSFTFEVSVISKYGTAYQYKLLPNDTASCTFRFAKKALFNNEYNLTNESERIKQNPQYAYHKR